MNKRKKFILFIIIGILLVGSFILMKNFLIGEKSFENLSKDEIEHVSVWVIPPNITLELTKEETNELVDILQNVKIYNRSWKHRFSGGQSCIFTITYNDGDVIEINAFTPTMIIDRKGYRAKYETCQELNQFANNLIQEAEMTKFEKFSQLDIDTRLIGLEKGDYGECFCTPVNASVIGEPVYLTKNGYGTMIVLSLEAYSKLTDGAEIALDEADKAAIEDTRRYTHDEVFSNLRRRING